MLLHRWSCVAFFYFWYIIYFDHALAHCAMHRWWFNIRCTYSRWWYFAKHEESWCSWVTVTKDNIKELLQSYIFFSSDGEATASLHKVQVIKISVLDVEIFELNLIRYSWLFHNFILSLHRENRERRIGIDRVKDAVEKCLQQVAEFFFLFLQSIANTWPKSALWLLTNIFLDLKQTMIKTAS